jgi:sarcosine oxidase subunit alpha
MPSIAFEGRRVPFDDGDTVGVALFRAGVRTLTRSIKHHRRRGLYCLSGDCANCLVTVDGDPGVRACVAEAFGAARVDRETGWPSTDRDVLAVADRAHRLLPVGFYYKAFIRPRAAWELAERVIRRATGIGTLPLNRRPASVPTRYASADVVVVGAGVAGLAAAAAAGERGRSVIVCDEGRIGERLPSAHRERARTLAGRALTTGRVEILERHAAIGVYEGPSVPLVGDELVEIDAERVVVATGAVEAHAVFRGNDLPGVWLGRAAARLAGGARLGRTRVRSGGHLDPGPAPGRRRALHRRRGRARLDPAARGAGPHPRVHRDQDGLAPQGQMTR